VYKSKEEVRLLDAAVLDHIESLLQELKATKSNKNCVTSFKQGALHSHKNEIRFCAVRQNVADL